MKLILSLFFSCILLQASAQKIEVDEDGWRVNGITITSGTRSSELEAIVGKPDRIVKLINDIWVYDRQGMYFYIKPDSLYVHAMVIDFDKTSYDFSPKQTFTGSYLLSGSPVTGSTSMTTIMGLKRLKFIKDMFMDNAEIAGLSLFFNYDEEDKERLRLNSTSINIASPAKGLNK